MDTIVSLQNSQVKKWASLHQKKYRDEHGLFLVENEHLIEEALKSNVVKEIIIKENEEDKYSFSKTTYVSEEVMKKICNSTSVAKYVAVCEKVQLDVNNPKRVVLLDNVQDPGNLGTIIRTCVAFGYDALYLSKDACDAYNDKCLQATQGAIFYLPIYRGELKDFINNIKKDGFEVIGTSLRDSICLKELEEKEKMAFVFGSEGNGISDNVLDLCDKKVIIEMNDFESLNVAVASGIVLYKFSK